MIAEENHIVFCSKNKVKVCFNKIQDILNGFGFSSYDLT